MREFNFKNLEKDIVCDDFRKENNKIIGIGLNSEEIYYLNQIPSIKLTGMKMFILQKNMCDYIIVQNEEEHLEFTFKIQQDIINNIPKIVNIYLHMYIDSQNSLSGLLDLSKQSVSKIYLAYLPYFLTFLPYSSKEIDWYK